MGLRAAAVTLALGMSVCAGAAGAASLDYSLTGNPLSTRWVRQPEAPRAAEAPTVVSEEPVGATPRAAETLDIGPKPILGESRRAEGQPRTATD